MSKTQLVLPIKESTPETNLTIVAIDPSMTCTGLAFNEEGRVHLRHFKSQSEGSTVSDRINRMDNLARCIADVVGEVVPDEIWIENYGFNSKSGNTQAEFGAILRLRLMEHCRKFVEIAPATIKKWMSGNGRADKKTIVQAIGDKYGRWLTNHDEADAYALLQYALNLRTTQ